MGKTKRNEEDLPHAAGSAYTILPALYFASFSACLPLCSNVFRVCGAGRDAPRLFEGISSRRMAHFAL
jgi:hypothetical protein